MPSTFTNLAYHIVFGTKKRQRFLHADWRERLFEYLGGIVRSEGGVLVEVGGVEDHVHLLVKFKPTRAVSDVVRIIKANSSKWVNEQGFVDACFAWQEGYGAFTVSESQLETVRGYLKRQEEHHREASFEEELQALCERHGVAFDAEHFGES